LSELSDHEADDLAVQYKRLLLAVDNLYPTPTPYISAWHQAPKVENREQIRLMLQITSPRRAKDKLKYLAGSESAMGAFVGDIAPEETASRIREALN
jgi:UDPglucose--hexose-1-phosphate uridylyltransferase